MIPPQVPLAKAILAAAASCLISLTIQEPSNNVKMIVLDRVAALHSKHERVIDSLVMDVLRVLASPDNDVRRKALAIALEMVSSRNVEDVVGFLKKELVKTLDGTFDKAAEYRQLLIQTVHTCAIKHHEVASSVVHVMMDFLGDASNMSAVDVIAFVREVVEKFPELRGDIVEKLLAAFDEIKSGKVYRGALWIVGEYGTTIDDIHATMQQIRKVIGEVPILASEQVRHIMICAVVVELWELTPPCSDSSTTQKQLAAAAAMTSRHLRRRPRQKFSPMVLTQQRRSSRPQALPTSRLSSPRPSHRCVLSSWAATSTQRRCLRARSPSSSCASPKSPRTPRPSTRSVPSLCLS